MPESALGNGGVQRMEATAVSEVQGRHKDGVTIEIQVEMTSLQTQAASDSRSVCE